MCLHVNAKMHNAQENEQLGNSIIFTDNNVFKELAIALDTNEAWLKIVDFLAGIFDPSGLHSRLQSPGEKLLIGLNSKLFTVGNLLTILRECELYDALAVLITEKIVIKKQPTEILQWNKLFVKRGNTFSLEFLALGIPQPTYCWYKNNQNLPEQTSSVLKYDYYTPEMEGSYHAIATQILADGTILETLISDLVPVETILEPCVVIRKPPKQLCVCKGQSVLLEVTAIGFPTPQYEWTYKNKLIAGVTKNYLQLTKAAAGEYRCRIFNSANELIVKTNITALDTEWLPVWPKPVVEKVALLIGNQCYHNLDPLSTPHNDICVLEPILKMQGFLVISCVNSNLAHMKCAIAKFCEILVPGAFAFFYFAGHGFELGDKCLLPVDAPDEANFGFKDSISEPQILRDVLNTQPKLFVFLLDTCRLVPDRDVNSKIYEEPREIIQYTPHWNLIQGYATTNGFAAYEVENGRNSLYVNAIMKFIEQDLTIMQLLNKVNLELKKFHDQFTLDEKQMSNVCYNVVHDLHLSVPKKGHPQSQQIYAQL